jgi:lipopolysaccharide export LptBFGC system permease protein LptF
MEENKTENEIKLKTLVNMNKQVLFLGFTPIQFILLVMIIMLLAVIFRLFSVLFIIPIVFVAQKLAKENKKGNPDFLKSYQAYKSSPKYLIDKGTLNYLEKK